MKRSIFCIARHAGLVSIIAALAYPAAALAKPSIGTLWPNSGLSAGSAVTLTASVSASGLIQSCNLYVDSEDKGAMTVAGGQASLVYAFPYARVYTAFVFCRETSGEIASGPNTSIFVTEGAAQPPVPPLSGGHEAPPASPAEPEPTPTSTASGRLVKLECPEGAAPDHACTAVYYVGADGKRHAFPNAKTYFTWYENFDAVETITSDDLAAISLGLNVTYRPGSRMVKFQTLNFVYAVAAGGILRWVESEGAAAALYGSDWNTKVDDIPDTFFTDYFLGDSIMTADDFSAAAELEAAVDIDAIFAK